MNWRKVNNVLHRDLGYFFATLIIIYSLSGIALNHINDWNPNYIIRNYQKEITIDFNTLDHKKAKTLLDEAEVNERYKSFIPLSGGRYKIFFENGSMIVDPVNAIGTVESIKRRAIFFESNYLHYNPNRLWTWVSDIFAGCLILITITGIFVLRGKKGITGRGKWFIAAGALVPLIFLIMYL